MKGSISDLPIWMTGLLYTVICIFAGYLILSSVSTAWPAGDAGKELLEAGVETMSIFDYAFVFLAVGIGAFMIISAFFVESHPIFFVFSLILLVVVILISVVVTNVFYEFATSAAFSAVANEFPMTVIFMTNLPLECLVLGVLIAIVMHGKPTGGSK